jgi:hypothetical protein
MIFAIGVIIMNEKIYIDFDGVIVDTQKRVNELFKMFNYEITDSWNYFLANLNWKLNMLPYAKEINNSFEILKELYKLKKDVYILSRVFSLNEAQDKINFLRDNGIYTDFIASPGRIEKYKVIVPNQNKLLIDDSESNVKSWIDNNGKGIYFTENKIDLDVSKNINYNGENYYLNEDNKLYFKDSVNSLDFLLRKKL